MDGAPPLDAALMRAWEHLKARRWADAVAALPDAHEPERPGAMARLHAFRAQAHYELGRMTDAEREVTAAARWARAEPKQPGLASVRELRTRILASLAAQQTADRERAADASLADRPDDALLAEPDGAALLIRKAHALADGGRRAEAYATAARVWSTPGAPLRERVLAALTLARCDDDPRAWLHAAHAAADRADDQNLIAAVARAARIAQVTLPLLP